MPICTKFASTRTSARSKNQRQLRLRWRPTEDTIAGHPLEYQRNQSEDALCALRLRLHISPNLLNHFMRVTAAAIASRAAYRELWRKLAQTNLGLKGVMQTTFPTSTTTTITERLCRAWRRCICRQHYQYDDNLSWQHGRHSLKFGVEARLQEFTSTSRRRPRESSPSAPAQPAPEFKRPESGQLGINYASFLSWGRVTKWGWQSQQNRIAPALDGA